jgi:hypothetical protein
MTRNTASVAAILLACAVLSSLAAHAQITSNVFERVLSVRVNAGTEHEGTATAFTVDVDGREYLITAKHVVKGLKDEDKIDIFMDGNWVPLKMKIFRCEDPIDIAVLIPPHQLTVNFELNFDRLNIMFGQDVYFLGFPYGLQVSLGGNGPYPMALVKKGLLSSLILLDVSKKATLILLDGYNNPGFSGGPIVFRDSSQSGVVLNLLGVVSGFIPEVVPAMNKRDIQSPSNAGPAAKEQPWKIKQRADGTFFEYVDSGAFVALNTGIVQGYMIGPAIDLTRQHPIGPIVKELQGNRPEKEAAPE